MPWTLNPYGLMGVAAWALTWTMALLVFASASHRGANRRLALLLVVEGAFVLITSGLNWMAADLETSYGLRAVQVMLLAAVPFLYLRFLATLDAPIGRVLRHAIVDRLLAAAAVVVPLAWFLRPDLFVEGLTPTGSLYTWRSQWGPAYDLMVFGLAGPVFVLGLVTAVQAFRAAAPGSLRRRQALGYLVAFAVRDGLYALIAFAAYPLFRLGASSEAELLMMGGLAVASVTFSLLMGYAILRTQLFDIDLRIKAGVRSSTLAAIFIALFFIVSELTSSLLSERVGPVLGVVAAGGLVFVLAPLQRFADRVASSAMPGVSGSLDYVAYRKLQVYRAAVEGALLDGEVTPREREVLERLRRELDIRPEDANALESEVAHTSTAGGT